MSVPTLPKHLRPRWRYLGVGLETWPDAELDRGAFQRHLWFAAQNLVGDAGSAAADLSVLGFAFEAPTGEAVVRARHGHVEPARAALACLDEVDGHPVGVHVRGISGTVRGCEEKFCPRLADGGRADDGRKGDERAGDGGSGERRSDERVGGGRRSDRRSGDGRPSDERTGGERSSDRHTGGERAGGRQAGGGRAGDPEEEKYIRRRREPTEERDVVFGGAERSALIRGPRADVRTGGAFAGATDFDLE